MRNISFAGACGCALSVLVLGTASCVVEDDLAEEDVQDIDTEDSLVASAAMPSESGMVLVPFQAHEVESNEASPPGCNRGAFCAYRGMDQTGTLLLETQGNWSGSISGVRSVFNNGVPWPGADHIQLDWNFNGSRWTECIHYNPGPGEYKINFVGVQIVRARWRGEC